MWLLETLTNCVASSQFQFACAICYKVKLQDEYKTRVNDVDYAQCLI